MNKLLIDKLNKTHSLDFKEWVKLFSSYTKNDVFYAKNIAQDITKQNFGNEIYIRGLIELSNICKNDCLYCGIRKSNTYVERYKLSTDQIMSCCDFAYKNDIKTFVLQSGEAMYLTDDYLCELIKNIKNEFPDCAITLSLGERDYESYKNLKDAGADRYLLRHETASDKLYKKLHPENMTLKNRMDCLNNLKKLGYQIGAGMMLGAPYQTNEDLAYDMIFLAEFKPEMVGIGPFVPAKNTPFESFEKGTLIQTLFFISLIRIMLPYVLLPATTALGTIENGGREQGILHGANVIMPNISPEETRKNYMLYNDKIGTLSTATDTLIKLKLDLDKIGYKISNSRGDYKSEA